MANHTRRVLFTNVLRLDICTQREGRGKSRASLDEDQGPSPERAYTATNHSMVQPNTTQPSTTERLRTQHDPHHIASHHTPHSITSQHPPSLPTSPACPHPVVSPVLAPAGSAPPLCPCGRPYTHARLAPGRTARKDTVEVSCRAHVSFTINSIVMEVMVVRTMMVKMMMKMMVKMMHIIT